MYGTRLLVTLHKWLLCSGCYPLAALPAQVQWVLSQPIYVAPQEKYRHECTNIVWIGVCFLGVLREG